MASIDDHRLTPDIPINAHISARCLALAQSLETRKAIYLDFRYWVTVREVLEGVQTGPEERKLIHHLTRLVRAGRIFCPISVTIFFELMNVGHEERREATIKAIEELSTGVTLVPEEARVEAEVEDIVRASKMPELPQPPRCVWTRLAYFLGHIHVSNTGYPPETERALQKTFFDHLWEQPLSAITAQLDPKTTYGFRAEMVALADKLNKGTRAHITQMKSFETVLADELSGAAELAEPALHKVIAQGYRTVTGETGAPDRTHDRTGLNLLCAFLHSEHAHHLPTLHIQASLHALLRWEHRDKLLTANDVFDFAHAAAALAYCDAFFTEKELAGSVAHRRIRLDKRYDCFVTNRTAEAVHYLKSLG